MSFSSFTSFVTDAGDSGLLLPVALVTVAMLWFFHSHRLAWLLLRSVLAASILITVLKILFLSCGAHWAAGLLSPSGHACLSAVVYGTLGTIVAAGRPAAARIAIALLVMLFVGVIAVSRIALGVHTGIEVLVGLLVGISAQLWFAWSYAQIEPLRIDLKTFAVAVTATLLIAFGIRIPAESFIRHMAKRVGDHCESSAAGRSVRVEAAFPAAPLVASAPPRGNATTSLANARANLS